MPTRWRPGRQAAQCIPCHSVKVQPSDDRLTASHAQSLLQGCTVLRCNTCGLVRLDDSPVFKLHARCGGTWETMHDPMKRSVMLRLLFLGFVRR